MSPVGQSGGENSSGAATEPRYGRSEAGCSPAGCQRLPERRGERCCRHWLRRCSGFRAKSRRDPQYERTTIPALPGPVAVPVPLTASRPALPINTRGLAAPPVRHRVCHSLTG